MIKRAAGFLIYRKFNEKIEYLLLKASYGSHHWTPPKGHVDPGEDDFTTALRETKEEAGYTEENLIIYKDMSKILNYNVKGTPKTVIYWLAQLKIPEQNPIISDEHEDFCWLEKDEAIKLSGYQDFAEMVEYFHEKTKEL